MGHSIILSKVQQVKLIAICINNKCNLKMSYFFDSKNYKSNKLSIEREICSKIHFNDKIDLENVLFWSLTYTRTQIIIS